MADRADAETDGTKGVRFSFRWDLGRTRLVMIDSRNGRILDHGEHLMLGESEFAWVEKQATDGLAELDHLLLGTSLPWLLPNAISDLESVNEIAAARPGWRGRLAEQIRQAGDLEHWAAFRPSFDRLTDLIADVGSSPDGPATVSVLSGDVHHGYVARARLERHPRARVHQITGSAGPGSRHARRAGGRPARGFGRCRCAGASWSDRCSGTSSPPSTSPAGRPGCASNSPSPTASWWSGVGWSSAGERTDPG
jgi:hypothetical protein